jgi:hypothetical protein
MPALALTEHGTCSVLFPLPRIGKINPKSDFHVKPIIGAELYVALKVGWTKKCKNFSGTITIYCSYVKMKLDIEISVF